MNLLPNQSVAISQSNRLLSQDSTLLTSCELLTKALAAGEKMHFLHSPPNNQRRSLIKTAFTNAFPNIKPKILTMYSRYATPQLQSDLHPTCLFIKKIRSIPLTTQAKIHRQLRKYPNLYLVVSDQVLPRTLLSHRVIDHSLFDLSHNIYRIPPLSERRQDLPLVLESRLPKKGWDILDKDAKHYLLKDAPWEYGFEDVENLREALEIALSRHRTKNFDRKMIERIFDRSETYLAQMRFSCPHQTSLLERTARQYGFKKTIKLLQSIIIEKVSMAEESQSETARCLQLNISTLHNMIGPILREKLLANMQANFDLETPSKLRQ